MVLVYSSKNVKSDWKFAFYLEQRICERSPRFKLHQWLIFSYGLNFIIHNNRRAPLLPNLSRVASLLSLSVELLSLLSSKSSRFRSFAPSLILIQSFRFMKWVFKNQRGEKNLSFSARAFPTPRFGRSLMALSRRECKQGLPISVIQPISIQAFEKGIWERVSSV